MKPLRLFARAGLAAVLVLVAYGAAALVLSHVPINRDFATTQDGVPVAVVDNGVHVDIVTPVSVPGVHDWRRVLPAGAVAAETQWLGFGWGAREFYMNTPTWAELDPWLGLKALFGVGGTTVRLHFLEALYERPGVTLFHLDEARYARLVTALAESMETGADGRAEALPGPGFGRDLFLAATGRYSPILTCNEWASRMLAAAGVRTAVWSPFPNGVALVR